jgi:uncharacterized protein YbbC (DUF1343 family)
VTVGSSGAGRVKVGLEVIRHELPAAFKGARVGLLAHAASRLPNGEHALTVLQRLDVGVVRLFGPEHGFLGAAEAGERVGDAAHAGLPLVSLYGARRAPDLEHLRDLDALVVDLQDVGVRAYTYLATLGVCLERCAEAGVPLLLLDRPNPLGRSAFGAGVAAGFGSFVSAHDVRFVHGMTLGELATCMARDLGVETALQVVLMKGYEGAPWPETGLPWHAPSPNLPRLESARLYPLTVFLEGTNLSEGRGTDAPFRQLGAPWLDGVRLAERLNERLPGLHAEPVRFTPASSKHRGVAVSGVRLRPTAPFDPLESARVLLTEVRRQDSRRFVWLGEARPFIDLLAGSDVLRRAVDGDVSETDFGMWLATGERLEAGRVRLYEL